MSKNEITSINQSFLESVSDGKQILQELSDENGGEDDETTI